GSLTLPETFVRGHPRVKTIPLCDKGMAVLTAPAVSAMFARPPAPRPLGASTAPPPPGVPPVPDQLTQDRRRASPGLPGLPRPEGPRRGAVVTARAPRRPDDAVHHGGHGAVQTVLLVGRRRAVHAGDLGAEVPAPHGPRERRLHPAPRHVLRD